MSGCGQLGPFEPPGVPAITLIVLLDVYYVYESGLLGAVPGTGRKFCRKRADITPSYADRTQKRVKTATKRARQAGKLTPRGPKAAVG
jgi:hypothetical protein